MEAFCEKLFVNNVVNKGYGNGYPQPPVAFDGDDTTGGYVYHTYTMELMPHEMRFLVDGNVIRRFPDRLIPVNNKQYDRISKFTRNCTYFYPAEFDIDLTPGDTLGTNPTSRTYMERNYFETHLSNPGMRPVTIGGVTYNAAHHLIDYIKIWDVPADVKISGFPK